MTQPIDIEGIINRLHPVTPVVPVGAAVPAENTVGNPECPGTTVELLKKLEEIFKDTLPPIEVYKRTPETVWILYGQQNVLNWIRTRINARKPK